MNDLDDTSLRALARSFYVVRMVRYALLVTFLVAFVVASAATDHPLVAVLLAAVALLLVASAYVTRQRYLSSVREPSRPSSP